MAVILHSARTKVASGGQPVQVDARPPQTASTAWRARHFNGELEMHYQLHKSGLNNAKLGGATLSLD